MIQPWTFPNPAPNPAANHNHNAATLGTASDKLTKEMLDDALLNLHRSFGVSRPANTPVPSSPWTNTIDELRWRLQVELPACQKAIMDLQALIEIGAVLLKHLEEMDEVPA